MSRFFQLTLRTHDVEGVRSFYRSVLGEGSASLNIVELHPQAVARGARPHWLGFIDVEDVDAAAAAFIDRGAMSLGPKWVNPEGLEAAVLRDPGGAVVAVGRPPRSRARGEVSPEVGSYVLNTHDAERVMSTYGELFGWEFHEQEDLGPLGIIHPFSWERGGPPVGAVSPIAGRRGVHPHWLFQLRVPSLEQAMTSVREGGGVVLPPLTLATGERVAVCEDSQGAAFSMSERR